MVQVVALAVSMPQCHALQYGSGIPDRHALALRHQVNNIFLNALLQAYFAAMAITIQRHWRGFWSRKYIFDFKARKRYLQRVAQVNAKVGEAN